MFIKKINEMDIKRNSILITFSIIINSIILALFIFLLPDSFKVNENQDYIHGYNPIALNIVNGESYNYFDSTGCNEPCSNHMEFTHQSRPPVFPLLIALTHKLASLTNFDQYRLLIFIQYLLHLASSSFILLIYLNWFQKPKVALFASILYSSYPLGLYLLKQPNSEVIFNFLLAFFVLIFTIALKNKKYLKGYLIYFSGLILGMLFLTRYLSIYLPIFILIFLLIYYRSDILKMASKMLIGMLIVILPWQIYSSNLTENQPERDFSTGVFVNGLHWEQIPDKGRSGVSEFMSDDLLLFMEKTREKWTLGDLSTKGEVVSYLIEESLESPSKIIELIFWKAVRSLYAVDSKRYEMETFLINSVYLVLLLVLYINRKKYINEPEDKKFMVLSIIVFSYFYLLTISVVPIVRYTLSGILLIIPLTSLLADDYRPSDKGN
jgi:4-amino-4-deoxy-L-arabinose transferase-like glycosyltransferase